MTRKTQMIAVLGIFVLLTMSWAGCNEPDDDDDEEFIFNYDIIINGKEFSVEKLFANQTSVTIKGSDGHNHTGISLRALVDLVPPTDKENKQYQIVDEDGAVMNVTWEDIKKGILTTDSKEAPMTVFPHLPGKYMIRNVTTIKPVVTPTISVVGRLFTWDQPFDLFESKTVEDNESNTYEGVSPSDLVNTSGLQDPGGHNFSLMASDNHSKEVTWDDMMNGVLVKDGRKSVFPELEKEYWITDIVRIDVI